MLLRSSSTPILGSLLPSITESPNNPHQSELHGTATKHPPPPIHRNKLSCVGNDGSQNFTKSLLSSPSVTKTKGRTPQNGFRRVLSEGNLQELANKSYNIDEFGISSQFNKKFARKPNISSLEPIPSFSLHKLGTTTENYDDSDEEEEDKEPEEGENVNFFKVENMISEERTKNVNEYGNLGFEGEGEGKLYLATGLGVSGITFVDGSGFGGHNGGGSYRPVSFNRDGGGGDNCGYGIEEHYKKMMEENPGNPLFLRNYAQFLYQTKGDLTGADEYYSRAILADPEDGEILSQYANLIWELHHDKERATNYFERAIQASSEDSHIHAAYANFLWDIEDDEDDEEEEENATNNSRCGLPQFHHGIMASATA